MWILNIVCFNVMKEDKKQYHIAWVLNFDYSYIFIMILNLSHRFSDKEMAKITNIINFLP